MSLAELLYGLNGEIGLRTPNFNQHIIHTSTAEEEILLDNMISDLTEKLSREILDDKGVFLPNINEIFRLSENNSSRTSKENALKRAYKGNEYSRDFYNYCIEISAEEYNFHKQIVKEKEAQDGSAAVLPADAGIGIAYTDEGEFTDLFIAKTVGYLVSAGIPEENIARVAGSEEELTDNARKLIADKCTVLMIGGADEKTAILAQAPERRNWHAGRRTDGKLRMWAALMMPPRARGQISLIRQDWRSWTWARMTM